MERKHDTPMHSNRGSFIDLNDQYLKMFYDETDDVKTWRDFVVLAVDGSVAEIPNSDENRMRYGTMGNNYVSGAARGQK